MFQECPWEIKYKSSLAVLDLSGVRNSKIENGVEVETFRKLQEVLINEH